MSSDLRGQTWTIRRLLEWTQNWLGQKGVDQPRLSAELLLAHALGCQKIDLYLRFDERPDANQTARLRALVKAAGEHKPVAYLTGVKEFYSLEFEVTPEVLIPRPETEALVSRAIELVKASGQTPYRMLEIGTGSGCIAVAVAHYAPAAEIVATDISAAALAVAARNVARHGLAGRIRLLEADGPDLPSDAIPAEGFDLVASNPPYVGEADWERLPENVRRYEPRVALLAGDDGLSSYRLLARDLPPLLKPQGSVLVEIGVGQEQAAKDVFARAGGWQHLGTHRDPADPHPRVLEFRRRDG